MPAAANPCLLKVGPVVVSENSADECTCGVDVETDWYLKVVDILCPTGDTIWVHDINIATQDADLRLAAVARYPRTICDATANGLQFITIL